MAKIILEGYIEVAKRDLETVLLELPEHIALTRQEAGCLVFEVKQDETNPYQFAVYEEFDNQQAFDCHQQRVRDSRWGMVTKDVARHYQIKSIDDDI